MVRGVQVNSGQGVAALIRLTASGREYVDKGEDETLDRLLKVVTDVSAKPNRGIFRFKAILKRMSPNGGESVPIRKRH